MKTRTGLQDSARFAIPRERASGMRRPPSITLSAGARLRRFFFRIARYFLSRKNANSASDNSLGDYVSLPKEFLENLDRGVNGNR